MKLRFNVRFFIVFFLIFVVEVLIALFVNDQIIRPYLGDFLVVVMIYYFIKSFVNTKTLYIVVFTLLFAYSVEIGQYFNLVERLSLQDNTLARVIIGSSFSWIDMIAYTLGLLSCYLIDRKSKA